MLERARRIGKLRAKKETVTQALTELIQRRRQWEILKALGTIESREGGITRRTDATVNLFVDTSLWSLVLRRPRVEEDHPHVRAFRQYIESGYGHIRK